MIDFKCRCLKMSGVLNMKTINIDKNKWAEICDWCCQQFDVNTWEFNDGPCRITLNNDADRIWFALRWGA